MPRGVAATMGEMTVNYSVGKKGLEQHQDDLRAALSELNRARGLMLTLMAEDQIAYESLTEEAKDESPSPAPVEAAVSMPTTRPEESRSGPPESPG